MCTYLDTDAQKVTIEIVFFCFIYVENLRTKSRGNPRTEGQQQISKATFINIERKKLKPD